MTAGSVLQRAGPADCEALLALSARFNAESEIAFDAAQVRGALAELLVRPELGRAYRILKGGKTVGYAVLTFGWSLEWGGCDAFVDEIYLAPELRGQGLGRAASSALLEEAQDAGLRALHLEVEADNAAALGLYRSLGFAGERRQLLTHRLR